MSNRTSSSLIGIVLLAAGEARRFGSDKLGAMLAGRSLMAHAVAAAQAGGVGEVVVVTRPGRRFAELDKTIRLIINADAASGLASSVQCGLRYAERAGWQAAIFAPADQPRLTGEVYARLAERHERSGSGIVVATYDGQIRNPVLIARSHWNGLDQLTGDTGLAAGARTDSAETVECGDIASVADVDTPADLVALQT